MATNVINLEKLTIGQLKSKIIRMGGNIPRGQGRVLRQPYVTEVTRLLEEEADGNNVADLHTPLLPSPLVEVEEVPTTEQNPDVVQNNEDVQEVQIEGAESPENVGAVRIEPAIHQYDVQRIVGRDVPCRDPKKFLTILQECMNGAERHTFRHISDDFVEKPCHQMTCCDCRNDKKYHGRHERAGSSVKYCVQCSYVYRGVCRYVVCRECRTTYEDKRMKERRLKRKRMASAEDEEEEIDDEYVSNHEEILFDEWRRNRVPPMYNPWE